MYEKLFLLMAYLDFFLCFARFFLIVFFIQFLVFIVEEVLHSEFPLGWRWTFDSQMSFALRG